MIKTINTLEPRLPLSDQALIESAGLPYPLPNGTSISCKVIAAGVNDLNNPRTIERETPIVTVVVDPGSGGDPDAMFRDDSLAVSLDWITENGTATVDIDNGVYDTIEWEVTETAQPPEGGDNPRSGNFPDEVGINRGIAEKGWETWSTFKAAFESGGEFHNADVADFDGRAFYASDSDRDAFNKKFPSGVTIKNAQFSGGPRLDWSYDDASGFWVANVPLKGVPHDDDATDDRLTHSCLNSLCIPRLQKNIPFQACWPINKYDSFWPWDIATWTESSGGFWIEGARGSANSPTDVMTCLDVDGKEIPDSNGIPITRPRHTVDNYRATNIETRSCDVLTEVYCASGPGNCDCNDDERGDATPSQYDPDALSILDYNLYKGEIRGLKFTSASIDAARLAELDAIFTRNDVSNIHMIINADANVTDDFKCSVWLKTGETDPTGAELQEGERFLGVPGENKWNGGVSDSGSYNWNGYMNFILTGDKEFIKDANGIPRLNKYAIEYNGAGNFGKIYYNPPNDDWLDDSGTPEGLLPVTSQLFRGNEGITLENCVFHTCGEYDSTPGIIQPLSYTLTLKNSLFFGCTMIGRGGRWNAESNYIWYPNFSGFRGIAHGSYMKNNNFYGMPRKSAVYAGAPFGSEGDPPDGLVYPVEVLESIFEGNYFDITFSNHGQGLSLYTNSWNNATVKNNIFHNCQAAMSHQPYGSRGTEGNPYTGTLVFENNLIIYQQNYGKNVGGGQATWAFNGAYDSQMPPSEYPEYNHDAVNNQDKQQVRYWNNTCLIDFNHPSWTDELNLPDGGSIPPRSIAELTTGYRISKAKHRNSQLVFANNLVVGVEILSNSSDTRVGLDGLPPNGGHVHINNLVTTTDEDKLEGVNKSYGYHDVRFSNEEHERLSQAYDFEKNVVINSAETGASDGGKVGVRWERYPTKDQMKNIPINWADMYVGDVDLDRWGGTSQEDYESKRAAFMAAGNPDPLTFSGGDQRPFNYDRVLVQQVLIERKVDGNTADTSVNVEEVFQFAQGGNADIVFSPASGVVGTCWFWHGNHATGVDNNGISWGATTTSTTDRVSFPNDDTSRRLEYYANYEILFIYTSADGTTVNGSVGDEYSFKLSPEGDQVYGVPVGEISNVGQPSYLKIPTSKSSQVGSPDGIPSWGAVGDTIEYFIYRLDPA